MKTTQKIYNCISIAFSGLPDVHTLLFLLPQELKNPNNLYLPSLLILMVID